MENEILMGILQYKLTVKNTNTCISYTIQNTNVTLQNTNKYLLINTKKHIQYK